MKSLKLWRRCRAGAEWISRREILAVALLCWGITPALSQEKEWTVEDYLRALPEKYQTYSGDFAKEPTAARTIKDLKNGYIAYLDKAPEARETFPPFPVFEIALFKSASGESLLAVSNYISDMVCTKHETYFLRKRGAEWIDVRAEVLPKLTAGMFFEDASLGPKYEAANKEAGNVESVAGWFYLHFSPPRYGTRMKVALDICDYAPEDEPELSFDEFRKKQKPVSLKWDPPTGTFRVSQ